MTRDDLAKYEAEWVEPVTTSYHGYDIYQLPPPGQGFAALEHVHPCAPHWYLAFVGIEPAIQSRGIGRALLAPVLEKADRTNTLCYLETPFPRTHAFYERLGFTRNGEHRPFVGAPQGVEAFLREPLTRGTAR